MVDICNYSMVLSFILNPTVVKQPFSDLSLLLVQFLYILVLFIFSQLFYTTKQNSVSGTKMFFVPQCLFQKRTTEERKWEAGKDLGDMYC